MKNNVNKILVFFTMNILALLLIAGCSSEKNKASKSIEQIQKENGIPVRVEIIKTNRFEKYFSFYGKFKGIKETTISSMFAGRIDKINVKPGNYVKKDQVIVEFPEDTPASKYQQAKAAFLNSEKNYNRMKALLAKGEIAQVKFDGAETQYLIDKRNYETMKDMLKLDAPYNGIVTEIIVHKGDYVKDKTPLFTVADLSKMKIRVWLSEEERLQIKKGMKVFATVAGKTFTGKVGDLSISVDPMKQAFYADLIFDNSRNEIMAGTTADVKIIIYENNKAFIVSRNLVKSDNTGSYVYLVKNSKAKKQYVLIGEKGGINYEIKKGLKVEDALIVEGNTKLTNGIKIKVVK